MISELNLFDSIEFLEPKCPRCRNKIDYSVTTKYDIREKAHICLKCGFVLR